MRRRRYPGVNWTGSLKNSICGCTALFCCYLSTTVTQLLFVLIKHGVARFAPFLVPFLLVLTILCSQDTYICCFFHIRKRMEKYGK